MNIGRGRGHGHAIGSHGTLLKVLLTRNADTVWIGGIENIATNNGLSGYDNLNKNTITVVRQAGQIREIKVRVATVATEVWFTVWRKDGETYDRVFAQNIFSQVTAGQTRTVILTDCYVQEGDYIALWKGAAGSFSTGYAESSFAAGSWIYKTGVAITGFENQALDTILNTSLVLGLTIPMYGQAPLGVLIGDSIIAGHPDHYSGVEYSLKNVPLNSIGRQLYSIDNHYVCQNMGMGGQTTTAIAARIATHVVALKPKFVIIDGGVNDIAQSVLKATFLTNWTNILNALQTASIIPIVLKIMPWTNGTNIEMATRDDWNADLAALVATYTDAICIDLDSTVGKNRVGGAEGNLWDIKTEYDKDGVHFNLDGYAAIAAKIDTEIKKKYRFQ